MVVNNEIKKLLIELGLTDYEARTYVALLLCQPATAYEVAKEAGIPSSKIYETVSRLLEKGVIQGVSDGKGRGQRYVALNSKDFIRTKQEEVLQKTDRLGTLLDSLKSEADTNLVWQLTTEDSIFNKAKQLIHQAEDNLLISLWPEELEELQEGLLDAVNRCVKVAMVHFGVPQTQIGATFHHPVEQSIYQEKGGRGLTVVADSQLVLMATFFQHGGVEGAWSRNHAFVTVAEDYVRHDVYITKVTAKMGVELRQEFGENYENLRDVFKPVE